MLGSLDIITNGELQRYWCCKKEDFKSFEKVEFEGGVYCSDTPGNPYKILVSTNCGKECNEFRLHKDTCFVCDDAFSLSDSSGDYLKVDKLYINDNYNWNLFIWGVKAKEIYYYGVGDSFYNKIYFNNETKFLYAPNLEWSRIKHIDLKIKLCCSCVYLSKNKDIQIKEDYLNKCNSYMLKSNKRFFDLIVNDEKVLDYFIENKLLKYENIHDLLLETNDDKFKQKIIDYRENVFNKEHKNEIANKKEIILPNEIGESAYLPVAKQTYTYFYDETVKKNFHKRFKVANYVKTLVKKGDLFLGRYLDEFLLLEVIKPLNYYTRGRGRSWAGPVGFKIVDIYNIVGSNNTVVPLSSSKEVGCIPKDSFIGVCLTLNGCISDDYICLGVERGLFKTTIYNHKKTVINELCNTKEWYLNQEELAVFDEFALVSIPGSCGHIVFRRIKDVNDLTEYFNLTDDYIINALNMQAGVLTPYDINYNIPENYVNDGGKEYKYLDILKFISEMCCVADRDFSITMFIQYFSDFYQNYHPERQKMEGFSKNDIEGIIKSNLVQDIKTGFYYYYDTIEKYKDGIYLYDKQWFKMFFEYIKKNKNKKINKISDIAPVVNNKSFYGEYIIPGEYFNFFYEMAIQCNYVDEFYTEIEKYLKDKMDKKESFSASSAIRYE